MRPTKAHYLHTLAQSAELNSPTAHLQGYELILAQLATHKRQLKQIQSMQRKAAFKRQIFPEYRPWIEGVLLKGEGRQDEVVMTWLIWAIDTGDYRTALSIGHYAIHHDLVLPERFNRTVATALAEELAEAAKRARDSQQPFEACYLQEVYKLTESEDIPDPVRAKLHRELAELLKESEPLTAFTHCNEALLLDGNCGVKGLRAKLEKQIKTWVGVSSH